MFDYAQKYEKARFSNFSWFFAKNCPKMAFFSFSVVNFLFTHTLSICDILFYSCGLVLQVWNAQICLKTWKRLAFLFFLFFWQKLPKICHFFHFRWSIFLTHTLSICDLLFYSCGLVHQVWNSQLCSKIWKGLFFLFFLIFCQKLPKNGNFFIFGGQFFFTHTLTICDLLFYSFGLVHQV